MFKTTPQKELKKVWVQDPRCKRLLEGRTKFGVLKELIR
jgi:hypothetical protein